MSIIYNVISEGRGVIEADYLDRYNRGLEEVIKSITPNYTVVGNSIFKVQCLDDSKQFIEVSMTWWTNFQAVEYAFSTNYLEFKVNGILEVDNLIRMYLRNRYEFDKYILRAHKVTQRSGINKCSLASDLSKLMFDDEQ